MILIYKDFVLKYIDLLTPKHIKEYAARNQIYLEDDEVIILYNFIRENYKELLVDESVLLNLKPLIRDDLYYSIVKLYQTNKTKFLS